jgi:hypothetical protein
MYNVDAAHLAAILTPPPPEAYTSADALSAISAITEKATSYALAFQMLGASPFLDLIYAGETIASISRITRIPHRLLKVFLDATPHVDMARQAGAEYLVDKATVAVDSANEDTTRTSKLRSEHYKWMAERIDRKQWGRNVSEDALMQPPFVLSWVLSEGVTVTQDQLVAMGGSEVIEGELAGVDPDIAGQHYPIDGMPDMGDLNALASQTIKRIQPAVNADYDNRLIPAHAVVPHQFDGLAGADPAIAE